MRNMAEKALLRDSQLSKHKFRASQVVRDVMQASPDFTKKSLLRASKNVVQQQDEDEMLQGLRELDKQGHMSRCTDPEGAQVWAEAVEGMVDEHVKFALNSAVDTLPHNANLAL